MGQIRKPFIFLGWWFKPWNTLHLRRQHSDRKRKSAAERTWTARTRTQAEGAWRKTACWTRKNEKKRGKGQSMNDRGTSTRGRKENNRGRKKLAFGEGTLSSTRWIVRFQIWQQNRAGLFRGFGNRWHNPTGGLGCDVIRLPEGRASVALVNLHLCPTFANRLYGIISSCDHTRYSVTAV